MFVNTHRKKKFIFFWIEREATALNTDAFAIHLLMIIIYIYILITSKEGKKKKGGGESMGDDGHSNAVKSDSI